MMQFHNLCLAPVESASIFSEYAGQILRIDRDEGIFLDVRWLSKVLNPIFSNKLPEDMPTIARRTQRDSLVHRGVLLWDSTLLRWRDELTSVNQKLNGRVIESLFSVLLKLGVICPLERPAFLANGNRGSKHMLAIMRLPEERTYEQQSILDCFLAKALESCQEEVQLKWKFDTAKAPCGLVVRLISSCYVIGEAERSACWRYGAFFMSREITRRHGEQVRLYNFLISYDDCLLSLRMVGPLSDNRMWAALRYVASAMVVLSMELPGVQWEGWLDCPNHPQARMYLTPPGEVRSHYLIVERDPNVCLRVR